MAQWQKKKKKNLPTNIGDTGSIRGSARSPGEGNGYPFQYSCLENSMDSAACWAAVYGVAEESDMTQQLNNICKKQKDKKPVRVLADVVKKRQLYDWIQTAEKEFQVERA